jgi:hypothetical protein
MGASDEKTDPLGKRTYFTITLVVLPGNEGIPDVTNICLISK